MVFRRNCGRRPARWLRISRHTSGTTPAWLAERQKKNWLESPILVYEVHLGSWQRVPEHKDRWLTYGELADQLVPYVKDLGYTHIELLPIMEHPFDGSWGYQTLGCAATSRFGTPADTMEFVDRCHQTGIGVILDWTPAHFPRDTYGLAQFDGTHLYEHADPRQGSHPDWGTLVYNYGRNEVQNFLISNALFWLDKYHIDGLRVDARGFHAVPGLFRKEGDWIPNRYGGRENLDAIAFQAIERGSIRTVSGRCDHCRRVHGVAERNTAGLSGRPGIQFEVEHGLDERHSEIFSANSIFRKYEHNKITFSLIYAFVKTFCCLFA